MIADPIQLIREHRFEEALQWASARLAARGDDLDAVAVAGAAYAKSGCIDDAVRVFRHGLLVDHGWVVGHYNVAVILAEKHRYWEALPHLRHLVLAGANDRISDSYLASALATYPLPTTVDERRATLVRLRTAHPQAALTWLLSARAYAEANDWRSAVDAYQRALSIEDSATTWRELAAVHMIAGDFLAAEEGYSRVIGYEPDDIDAITWLRRIRGALNPAESTGFDHHAAFAAFAPFRGRVSLEYDVDFLGVRWKRAYFPAQNHRRVSEEALLPLPPFDEEYFEWIDLLEAVLAARESFTMLELGAGFGRWGIRGAIAARMRGIRSVRLGLVEGEPQHHAWIADTLIVNGIDPALVDIYNGVIGEHAGTSFIHIANVFGEPSESNEWYGQSKFTASARPLGMLRNAYHGHDATYFEDGTAAVAVRQFAATDILRRYERIDLIDMDVQGAEAEIIRGSIDELDQRVKRLHISTHSTAVETDIRCILAAHGWRCTIDYPLHSTNHTRFGNVNFCDGRQTWINPRLA